MIKRAELKAKGKIAFKRNYWLCVLAALIIALFCTGTYNIVYKVGNSGDSKEKLERLCYEYDGRLTPAYGIEAAEIIADGSSQRFAGLSFLLSVLVFKVLEIGGAKFFTENTNSDASLGQMLSGFSGSSYGRNVVTMLLMRIFIVLWGLLLVIPGIVKAYEYCMVPYILADDPNIGRREAFALSKQMMKGNKMYMFFFDLSFIGWWFLAALTGGLVGVFYAFPYYNASKAEIYISLSSSRVI